MPFRGACPECGARKSEACGRAHLVQENTITTLKSALSSRDAEMAVLVAAAVVEGINFTRCKICDGRWHNGKPPIHAEGCPIPQAPSRAKMIGEVLRCALAWGEACTAEQEHETEEKLAIALKSYRDGGGPDEVS